MRLLNSPSRMVVLALLVSAGLSGAQLCAQTYPSRPLRIIVPFSPGGAADILARVMSDSMSRKLGQPVLVVNRDGGGTVVGMNEAAHATPDGYTMLLAGDSAIVNAASGRKLPYDLFKDLQPLSMVIYSPQAMMVRRVGPFNTLQDLVKYAKDNPARIKFGSTGVGAAGHLSAEMFNFAAGIRGVHVPYRGAGPAMVDLAGGQIDFNIVGAVAAISAVNGGLLRAVAIFSKERLPQLPDVPTHYEQGLNIDMRGAWFGLFLTGGSPTQAINRVLPVLKATMAEATFEERLRSMGGAGRFMVPQEFTAFMKLEVHKVSQLLKQLDLKLED